MEKTLHRDGLPAKILEFVKNGEKNTIPEIANKFEQSEAMIRNALQRLRKQGYWYVQIMGYEPNFGEKAKSGMVVDIRENENWALESKTKKDKNFAGRLVLTLREAEGMYETFVGLRTTVEAIADDFQKRLIEHRAQLRITNGYGNKTNSTQQTKTRPKSTSKV